MASIDQHRARLGVEPICKHWPITPSTYYEHKARTADPTCACPGEPAVYRPPSEPVIWVADITFVAAGSGFVYVAFVVDVFSRRIVGWQVGTTLGTDLVLDALEQALWSRRDTQGLSHHSDHGSQYLSVRYTERLAKARMESSAGSVGDSYDNALAETIIGLYKDRSDPSA